MNRNPCTDGQPMVPDPHRIRPATPAELPALANLIATAFDPLPLTRWLLPDPADRQQIMPGYFTIFLTHAMHHGQVTTASAGIGTSGGAGRGTASSPMARGASVSTSTTGAIMAEPMAVAVWLPPETPPIADYQHWLAAVCDRHTPRFAALDQAMARHHPSMPCHHLLFLAVHPEHQGRGLGAALLNHHSERLDQAGDPAYLEAESADLRDFYQRHGYQPAGSRFTPTPGAPVGLYPMVRQPATEP